MISFVVCHQSLSVGAVDYKSVRVVVICATLVNTQTHSLLTGYTIS